jgi:AcrR family transcriptional regulator
VSGQAAARPAAPPDAAAPATATTVGPSLPGEVTPPCAARPGRPRSVAADEAILDATLDLFADRGFEGVSIEAVAEQAGVAKSTVYRRYPTKIELVMGAWRHAAPIADVALATGSLHGDLLVSAHRLRTVFTQSPAGRAVPSALAAAARFPEFAEAHHRFIADRRAPMLATVEHAIERGDLRPDTDATLLIDLITGPIFYRAFNTGGTLTDADLDALDLHGFAADAAAELFAAAAPEQGDVEARDALRLLHRLVTP